MLTKRIEDDNDNIHLLVSDYFAAKRVLDAESTTENRYEDGYYRVHNRIRVGNTWKTINIRFVGDGYFDLAWEMDMLGTRRLTRGVYVLEHTHYKYSMLYHAFFHNHHPSVSTADVVDLKKWKQKKS